MTEQPDERLYNLLPEVYQRRDAKRDGELRTLLSVMDRERERIEKDIDGLYADQFIETCDEWVIPYIADLLDLDLPEVDWDQRARVANTIAYRRRKGTLPAIEQLARDVTGWPAVGVEFVDQLSRKRNLDLQRPEVPGFVDLQDPERMERAGGPFDETPRTVELRSPETGRGKHHIPNIGVYLWTVQSYPMKGIQPKNIGTIESSEWSGAPTNVDVIKYQLHPAGPDIQLYNRPASGTDRFEQTDESDLPIRLRRRLLSDDLPADSSMGSEPYFGRQPVFSVDNDPSDPKSRVSFENIYVCNLDTDDWLEPNKGADPSRWDIDWTEEKNRYFIDSELGRMLVVSPKDLDVPDPLRVGYARGKSMSIGGGPYNRNESVDQLLDGQTPEWQMGVSKLNHLHNDPEEVVSSVQKAIDKWNKFVKTTDRDDQFLGVISIMDNGTYFTDSGPHSKPGPFEIHLPENHRLAIVGAHWPEVWSEENDKPTRVLGRLEADERRPCIENDGSGATVFKLTPGSSMSDTDEPGDLLLDGLLVNGSITVENRSGSLVHARHCTFVPQQENKSGSFTSVPSVDVSGDVFVDVKLVRTIAGTIQMNDVAGTIQLQESVVGGRTEELLSESTRTDGIIAPDAEGTIDRSTVFGSSRFEKLDADDSIFTDTVRVEQQQQGCVRYSYIPYRSRNHLPRRYKCQPFLALREHRERTGAPSDPSTLDPDEQALLDELTPQFISRHWSDAQFARLTENNAGEIRFGAENNAAMGVYNDLLIPQRTATLRQTLDEQMRVGLHHGIFLVT